MDVAQQLAMQYAGVAGMGAPVTSSYLPPVWSAQSHRRFSVDEYGNPTLKVYDFGNGGVTHTVTGKAALINSDDPRAIQLRHAYGVTPEETLTKNIEGDGYGATIGKTLHNWAKDTNPSWLGRVYDSGPLAGSALTAGTGWLLGALYDKLLGEEGSIPKSTIGLLGGGLLGGIIGHIRSSKPKYYEMEKSSSTMEKKSVAFQNPRNFILERLQGATDLSPIQKAQLASRVRSMGNMEAERLKGMVRAAAGFGVGALIAKFFGASTMGAMASGVVGAVARTMMAGMAPRHQSMIWSGPKYF